MIDDPVIDELKRQGLPVTRAAYISLNYFGTPPNDLTAEELDDLPDYPWEDEEADETSAV